MQGDVVCRAIDGMNLQLLDFRPRIRQWLADGEACRFGCGVQGCDVRSARDGDSEDERTVGIN